MPLEPFSKITAEEKLQLLNRQIRWARENSKFYAYLPEQPLESLKDLEKIPPVLAQDLVQSGRSMLCIRPEQVKRMVTAHTSGTTGEVKRLAFSERDIENTIRFFAPGMHTLAEEGSLTAVFMPGSNPDGLCDILCRSILRFGGKCEVPGPVRNYQEAADFCRRRQPQVLVGFPSELRRLALEAPDLRPQRVLLSADYIPAVSKKIIADSWNCQVFEHYGMTETGYGGAVETPFEYGMISRNDLLIETDEEGGIYITTLDREAMPLIRYRTGDIGALCEEKKEGGKTRYCPNLLRVDGREEELKKGLSIMQLDQVLLAEPGILDFTAADRGKDFFVQVAGDAVRAASLLGKAFPEKAFTVEEIRPAAFAAAGKRSIANLHEQAK